MGSNPSAFFSIQVALCSHLGVECVHYDKCLPYKVSILLCVNVAGVSGQIKKVGPLKDSNERDDRKHC